MMTQKRISRMTSLPDKDTVIGTGKETGEETSGEKNKGSF